MFRSRFELDFDNVGPRRALFDPRSAGRRVFAVVFAQITPSLAGLSQSAAPGLQTHRQAYDGVGLVRYRPLSHVLAEPSRGVAKA